MTRNYNDYTIRVNQILHPSYGMGYTAEIFVPKTDGRKANVMVFQDFNAKAKPGEIVDFCKKIIDLR